MKSYVGYYTDNIRDKSSSGGIFSALADYVFKKNGVVYGVSMSEDFYSAHYTRVSCAKNINKLIGSKYMQASVGNAFRNVKLDLDARRVVLFVGTACQINGLKSFLNINYDKLICVDIICHGVPSKMLWKQYLQNREKQIGKCRYLNFRSKDQGWYNSGIKENEIYTPQNENTYMRLFLKDLCLRPSCYECISKKNILSDFTLGDFWGVNNIAPEMNDDRGLSVIILRTVKAQKIIESIREQLVLKEVTYDEAVQDNPAEYESAKRPIARKNFYRDLQSMTFNNFEKKYLETTVYWKIYGKIKRKLSKLI